MGKGQDPPSPAGASFPLRWDPRDPPAKDRPAGDFKAVLERLDKLLAEEESPERLGAKMITLAQLGEPEERIAEVAERLIELGAPEDPDELRNVARNLAFGRLLIAEVLGTVGDLSEADQALSDVASFYETDEDPFMRAVAVSAIEDRIRVLIKLHDLDGVKAAWDSVLAQYGTETQPPIRSRVAACGRWAAAGFQMAQRTRDVLSTSAEVIDLYQSDSEAATRAHVAATMIVRYLALPLTRQRARMRARGELHHFIGSSPEPEVVEALTETHRKLAAWLLRGSHDPQPTAN